MYFDFKPEILFPFRYHYILFIFILKLIIPMNFSISGTSGFYLNAQFCLLFSSLFYCISIFSFTKENKLRNISLYVLYYRIQQTIVHNIQSFEDKPAVMCDRPQITTQ